APAPEAPARPTTAPTAAVAPAPIELRVNAEPPAARIFLDDAPLASNPYAGKFPSDGTGHRVRVEAPGYAPQTAIAIFDKDVALDVHLEPEAAPSKPAKGDASKAGAEP